MLRRLSVENYVLIDKLRMELDPHLNIITGETGAGKSILLGALGLLLGAKNDSSAMKDAARNCVVEGTFDLSGARHGGFLRRERPRLCAGDYRNAHDNPDRQGAAPSSTTSRCNWPSCANSAPA